MLNSDWFKTDGVTNRVNSRKREIRREAENIRLFLVVLRWRTVPLTPLKSSLTVDSLVSADSFVQVKKYEINSTVS